MSNLFFPSYAVTAASITAAACTLNREQKNFAARYVTAQTAIPPSRNCQSAFVFRIRIQLAAAGISSNKDMAQKYSASLPVSSRKPAAKP